MLKNSDIIDLARELVKDSNDPGECADFGRAVKYILNQLAAIAKDGSSLADMLREIAADVRYPDRLTVSHDDDDDTPCEGDYVLSDTGPLGSKTLVCVVGGKTLGTYDDFDSAMQDIRLDMERGKFWPNVWTMSDHGNLSLVTDELPEPEEEI